MKVPWSDLDRLANEMIDEYDQIIAKIQATSNDEIQTIDGVEISKTQLHSSQFATYNRIQMGARSLKGIEKEFTNWTKGEEFPLHALTMKQPAEMVSHTETFFMFLISSFEMMAWMLHYVHQTGLSDRQMNFTELLKKLEQQGKLNTFLTRLKIENENGWIMKLRQYRNYIVHRGHLQIKSRFRFNQGSVELKLLVLPDNPTEDQLQFTDKELLPYCLESLKKSLGVARDIFKHVHTKLA